MDIELKKKWVDALRSGEYHQAKGVLRETIEGTDKFCCLGVFCDIVDPSGWKSVPINDRNVGWLHEVDGHNVPVERIKKLYERFANEDDTVNLFTKNDGGASFRSIAQWIEENL